MWNLDFNLLYSLMHNLHGFQTALVPVECLPGQRGFAASGHAAPPATGFLPIESFLAHVGGLGESVQLTTRTSGLLPAGGLRERINGCQSQHFAQREAAWHRVKEMGAPTGDGSRGEVKRKGGEEQTLLGLSLLGVVV